MSTAIASLDAPLFDLAETLDSGQVFHWTPCEASGGFVGCIGEAAVWIRQTGDQLEVYPSQKAALVRSYLRLDADHAEVLASFPKDPAMQTAVAFCPGLRVIRQPSWECLATFITSSLKQVAHIRQISLKLRESYGQAHILKVPDGPAHQCFAYPTPAKLEKAGEAALRACQLGYRAKSLHQAAVRLTENPALLQEIGKKPLDEAREALCEFYGVGEKIADCVLLFAFDQLAAFPIDVWIERILRQRYDVPTKGKGGKLSRAELATFASSHFGEYGGYAQQFLFHQARKSGELRKIPPAKKRLCNP